MSLTWKTSFSGRECRIFRGKLMVGLLKLSLWKTGGYGELQGYLLRFKTNGIWRRNTVILDIDGKKELGEIKFNLWKGSATITYDHMEYAFKYHSWTRRQWTVTAPDESATFEHKGLFQKEGVVENDDLSFAVILSALYADAYFRRLTATVS
ncbi:hypothetical protein [Dyadobacter sandarakinus]|uniref:Uncharacterized protein n=1 Tax=Dyadobacter sandarakinus TaxID=2747268 RepID=A0ABX7IBF2_9BACT|nr:hypothetical protein [Dyadobacter sandarakinus]QRR02857.1 hypothetical protein HWI92_19045 [Dyadobacter sandarakinus]